MSILRRRPPAWRPAWIWLAVTAAVVGKEVEPRGSHEIVLTAPPATPVEGLPIGNGRMGTLVWTTPGAVEFQINRVDAFAVNRQTRVGRFGGTGRHGDLNTDYGGGCGRVSVSVGGEPFREGPRFTQRLSLDEPRCEVLGEGVRVDCLVAAEDDVLIVTVCDERPEPLPIDVKLAMWREPEVKTGGHIAAYAWRQTEQLVAVVQTFREEGHFCGTALAATCPGTAPRILAVDAQSRILRLPAAAGPRTVLIASAASLDERHDVFGVAERLLTVLAAPELLARAEDRHRRWWRDFRSRTFVRVRSPDGTGERAVRDRELFLHHMACTSRGAYPPKWNGSVFLTDGDARDWGNQYWLWTTEILYWPLHAADAGDLSDPFFEMYHKAQPAMAVAARQRWNADGVFLPEVMPFDGPTELPPDAVDEYRSIFLDGRSNVGVSSRLAAACGYDRHLNTLLYRADEHPGGYSWISHLASSAAELAVHAWWRYRHTGDAAWLRTRGYPLLRGATEFYRSIARRGADGLWHIHATNAHEDFWGVGDGIMDLSAIRGTVPLALRAAEILDIDHDLRGRWRSFLADLAPYPMGGDPRARALTGGVLADDAWAAGFLGEVDGSHNPEDVQLTPIFPFEDWTLETDDPVLGAVARRTLSLAPRHRGVFEGERLSTAVRSPIAAVRAGQGELLPAMLVGYRAAFVPLANGFSLFEQHTPGHQAHSIEHLALLAMILQESLLQSVAPRPGEAEVIRVFPAWPRGWDGEFRLLARGGFLVSAACLDGDVQRVEIESRFGEICRLHNPWGEACVLAYEDGSRRKFTGPTLRFETRPGGRYGIDRSSSVPSGFSQ